MCIGSPVQDIRISQGGVSNPACNQSWLPPGGTSCSAIASHPLVVAPFGMVNGRARGDRYGIDIATMNNTVASVRSMWGSWTSAWGWDDGLIAMSMVRLAWDPVAVVEQV